MISPRRHAAIPHAGKEGRNPLMNGAPERCALIKAPMRKSNIDSLSASPVKSISLHRANKTFLMPSTVSIKKGLYLGKNLDASTRTLSYLQYKMILSLIQNFFFTTRLSIGITSDSLSSPEPTLSMLVAVSLPSQQSPPK